MFHDRKKSSKADRKARDRKRRFKPAAHLERLEDRLTPVVTANLTAGQLSVLLSAEGDRANIIGNTGTVSVYSGSTLVGSYAASNVASLSVDGPDGVDDLDATIQGTIRLTGNLSVTDLDGVTFAGGASTLVSAGGISVDSQSILVQGATLSTRKINANQDPGTAPSIATSGPITLVAPAIVVADSSRLLAHGSGSGSIYRTFPGGDVTITARDESVSEWGLGLIKINSVDPTATIAIGAARITGKAISIDATATNSKTLDLETDIADDTRAIATADFNGDGRIDLVTGNNGGATRLYLNNGTDQPLELVAAKDITGGYLTTAIAAGDLNKDGRPDVVLGTGDGKVVYLLNKGGDDPFAGSVPVVLDTAGAINDLKLADFNQDGRLDLITASSDAMGKVYLSGAGSVLSAASYEVVPIGATTIAVGDFDGGGAGIDFVASVGGASARFYPNTLPTLGSFTANPFAGSVAVTVAGTAGATDMVAADLNGDGRLDLAIARSKAAPLVFLTNATGSPFQGVSASAVGGDAFDSTAITVADLNGDGKPDLIVANNDGPVRLYTNKLATDGKFDAADAHEDVQQAWDVELADVTGDGKLDLIVGNGSTVQGGTNLLSAVYANTGETKDPFGDSDAQLVTPENELADEVTASDAPLLEFLEDLSLLAAVIRVEPTATVVVNSGAMIEGSGSVRVTASASAEASVDTIGAYLGFNYAKVAPTATVWILGNAQINAQGDVSVTTSTATSLDMSLSVPSKGAVGNLVASYGRTDATSTIRLASPARVSGGNVQFSSTNEDHISQTASSIGFQSSKSVAFGICVTVGDYNSTVDVGVAGTVVARGSVNVVAQSDRPENVTRASSSVIDSLQNKPVVGSMIKGVGSLLSKFSVTQKLGQSVKTPNEDSKLSLAGAVNVSDSDNTARASIDGGAKVTANGMVSVTARATDDFQASASASAGNAKKLSLGGAVNVALTDNDATATIGNGAQVDGNQGVRVNAEAYRPRRFEYLGLDLALPDSHTPKTTDEITSTYDQGYTVADFIDLATDVVKSALFTGSELSGMANTLVYSGASGTNDDAVGIAFGITYLDLGNHSDASIGDDARINQDTSRLASSSQDVSVTASSSVSTLNVAGQASALKFKGAFGTQGDKGAFGGMGDVIVYDNGARAHVGDRAAIRAARDVTVSSDAFHYNLEIVQAGAAADKYAFEGSIAFFDMTGKSEAWVEDTARIVARETVNVLATQDVFLANATGGLVVGGTAGVGISGGINVADIQTRAFIGDTNATTPGSAAGVSARNLNVKADTSSRYWAFSISGAVGKGNLNTAENNDEFLFSEVDDSGFAQQPVDTREGGFALSGAAVFHWIDETTEAYVADTGPVLVPGTVAIDARSDGWYISGIGSWAGANNSGIGGAFGVTRLDQDTHAYTGNVRIDAGTLSVTADSDNLIVVGSAGASGSKNKNSVAGSLGFVRLWTDTVAELGAGTQAFVTAGPTTVRADDELDLWNIAAALTFATGTDTKFAVGAAVALDIVDPTVKATIAPGVVVNNTGGDVVVSAIGDHDLYTIGAAIAGATSGGTGAAGSAAAVQIDPTIEATIGDGANVSAAGTLFLDAHHDYDEVIVAGAGAGGKEAGIGVSIGLTLMDRSVKATIGDGAIVNAQGRGAAAADPDGSGPSGRGVILDATVTEDLLNIAGGVVISTQKAGVQGSGVISIKDTTTEASIGDRAIVTALPGILAPDAVPGVRLRADHDTSAIEVAGGFQGAKQFGLGLAATVLDHDRTTLARIGDAAIVQARGDVRVEAQATGTTIAVAAAVGGAEFGVEGSAVALDTDNTTAASIGDRSIVRAGGHIVVAADHAEDTTAVAGAVGIGKTGGFGISVVAILEDDTTHATVGESAVIRADALTPTTTAYLGDRDGSNEPVATSVRGVAVGATNDAEILTIAGGAAGAGKIGAAGSVTFTKLNQDTGAGIGSLARVDSAADVTVRADDRLHLQGFAGQVALSGSVGIGAGAEAAEITKSTLAAIGQGAIVNAADDVEVKARSNDNILSVAGSIAIGGSGAGVGLSGSGSRLDLDTHATVGDYAQVTADGNVVVAARGDLEVLAVAGSITGSSTASVGGSAAITLVNQDTQALIGDGAVVIARGLDPATTVDTGDFLTTYSNYSSTSPYKPPVVKNYNNIRDAALSADSDIAPKSRQARGLAVSAVTDTRHRTFAVSGGVAQGAVQISGNLVLPDVVTRAAIGANAAINPDLGGASEAQGVLVTSGTNWYQLNVAGTLAIGEGAVNPGFAALSGDFTTESYVGPGTVVRSLGDVVVDANSLVHTLPISAGVSGGFGVVVGSLSLIDIDVNTYAYLAGTSVTDADGNVAVTADSQTISTMIAGNASLSGAGLGAALDFVHIAKDTRAYVGDSAVVNARGNRAGTTAIYDGTVSNLGVYGTRNVRGLAVQAHSVESLFNIAAAGTLAGTVGFAGTVTIEFVNANTYAFIGDSARINQGGAQGGVDQDVVVSAIDDFKAFAVAGALSAGLAAIGLAGGVDVGILRNDTRAYIGNDAQVDARDDVDVEAKALRDIQSYAVSVGAGTVGLGAAVSVWSIGGTLSSTGLTSLIGDGKTLQDTSDYIDDALSTSTLSGLFDGYSDDTDQGDLFNRIAEGTASGDAPAGSADLLGSSAPVQTFAGIGARARVNAGGSIDVHSSETIDVRNIGGGGYLGLFTTIGGSPAILTIDSSTAAAVNASARLEAGDEIKVRAKQYNTAQLRSYGGSLGGFIALTVQYATIEDNSDVSATIGDGVVIPQADSVLVDARLVRNLATYAFGGNGSLGLAGGAAIAATYADGSATASIGDSARIGAEPGQSVGSVTVTAFAQDELYATAYGVQVGIGAGAYNLGGTYSTPTVTARIGAGADVEASSTDIRVDASTQAILSSSIRGVDVGGLSIGLAKSTTSAKPTVTAEVDDLATVVAARDLIIDASAEVYSAAAGDASGGGLLKGHGTEVNAYAEPEVLARIGTDAHATAGRDASVTAGTIMHVFSTAGGITVSGLEVGGNYATATITPQTHAVIADRARLLAGRDITIDATNVGDRTEDGVTKAGIVVYAQGSSGALVGAVGSEATLNLAPEASARVSQGALVDAVGQLDLHAKNRLFPNISADNNIYSLLSIGSTHTYININRPDYNDAGEGANTLAKADAGSHIEASGLRVRAESDLHIVNLSDAYQFGVGLAGSGYSDIALTTETRAEIDGSARGLTSLQLRAEDDLLVSATAKENADGIGGVSAEFTMDADTRVRAVVGKNASLRAPSISIRALAPDRIVNVSANAENDGASKTNTDAELIFDSLVEVNLGELAEVIARDTLALEARADYSGFTSQAISDVEGISGASATATTDVNSSAYVGLVAGSVVQAPDISIKAVTIARTIASATKTNNGNSSAGTQNLTEDHYANIGVTGTIRLTSDIANRLIIAADGSVDPTSTITPQTTADGIVVPTVKVSSSDAKPLSLILESKADGKAGGLVGTGKVEVVRDNNLEIVNNSNRNLILGIINLEAGQSPYTYVNSTAGSIAVFFDNHQTLSVENTSASDVIFSNAAIVESGTIRVVNRGGNILYPTTFRSAARFFDLQAPNGSIGQANQPLQLTFEGGGDIAASAGLDAWLSVDRRGTREIGQINGVWVYNEPATISSIVAGRDASIVLLPSQGITPAGATVTVRSDYDLQSLQAGRNASYDNRNGHTRLTQVVAGNAIDVRTGGQFFGIPNGSQNLIAPQAVVVATQGVDLFRTAVDRLAVRAGAGQAWFVDQLGSGTWTLAQIGDVNGISAGGSILLQSANRSIAAEGAIGGGNDVTISSGGSIDVYGGINAGRDLNLTATRGVTFRANSLTTTVRNLTAAAGTDFAVEQGARLNSLGFINVRGAHDVLLAPGSALAATGDIIIVGAESPQSASVKLLGQITSATSVTAAAGGGASGVGVSSIEVGGSIDSPSSKVTVYRGVNAVRVNAVEVGKTVTINSFSGTHAVTVGDGLLAGIKGNLVVARDPNNFTRQLTLNVNATGAPVSGQMTSSQITGLGMAGNIQFANLAALNVNLGNGRDTFSVLSVPATTLTTVNGGGNTDDIRVLLDGINGPATVNAPNSTITLWYQADPTTLATQAARLSYSGDVLILDASNQNSAATWSYDGRGVKVRGTELARSTGFASLGLFAGKSTADRLDIRTNVAGGQYAEVNASFIYLANYPSTGSGGPLIYPTGFETVSITTEGGNDSIKVVETNPGTTLLIATNGGNDQINVLGIGLLGADNAKSVVQADAGAGNDLIYLDNSTPGGIAVLVPNLGTDTVDIRQTPTGQQTSVQIGQDDDTISILGDRLGSSVNIKGAGIATGLLYIDTQGKTIDRTRSTGLPVDGPPAPGAVGSLFATGTTGGVFFSDVKSFNIVAPPVAKVTNADASNRITIRLGQSLSLTAQGHTRPNSVFAWDLNGDGIDDFFGRTQTLTAATLNAYGIRTIGNYTIRLRVTDNLGNTAFTTVTLVVTR